MKNEFDGFLDNLPDLNLPQQKRKKKLASYQGPHGIQYRRPLQEQTQSNIERQKKENAKQERFRASCKQGIQYFSIQKIRTYWLKQIEIAASLTDKPWGYGSTRIEWPKDKPTVYAVMAFSMQENSIVGIIPESLKDTEWYTLYEIVGTWVCYTDISVELLSYIEEDLREQGLLEVHKSENSKPASASGTKSKETSDEEILPDYRAINLAKRTITIGTKTYPITSEKIWDFIKDLCIAFREDRMVPSIDGSANNKSAVDQLRKQIGNYDLHKLILFVTGGYKLNPDVKIPEGGQIGIRKTHLSHKQK